MKKSKIYLKHEAMLLLSDFLDEGYTVREALTFLENYDYCSAFSFIQSKMNDGFSLNMALSMISLDKQWFEYFSFISQYTTLSEAIRGASHLSNISKKFTAILSKHLIYPLCLILFMALFSIFFEGLIFPQVSALSLSLTSTSTNLSFLLKIFLKLPFIWIMALLFIIFFIVIVLYRMKQKNFQKLYELLNIPFVSIILQYYYSLKFALFYGTLTQYISGLRDSVFLMYEKMSDSDLMVVIYLLKNNLENGHSFEQSVSINPFFHKGLIQYIQLLLKQGKAMTHLEKYVKQTELVLEKKLQRFSRSMMVSIYGFTAIYIIVLYLMLMLPMLNMASQI